MKEKRKEGGREEEVKDRGVIGRKKENGEGGSWSYSGEVRGGR